MAEGTTCSKFVKLVPTMKHPPECTRMHDALLSGTQLTKKSGRFVSLAVCKEITGARHVRVCPGKAPCIAYKVVPADTAFL